MWLIVPWDRPGNLGGSDTCGMQRHGSAAEVPKELRQRKVKMVLEIREREGNTGASATESVRCCRRVMVFSRRVDRRPRLPVTPHRRGDQGWPGGPCRGGSAGPGSWSDAVP